MSRPPSKRWEISDGFYFLETRLEIVSTGFYTGVIVKGVMNAHSSVRVVLGIMVAVAFLFGGVASVSACNDEVECDGDTNLETGDQKEDVYLSGGASGGASNVTDAGNATTRHDGYVYVNSGYVNAGASASVERP